MSFLDIMGLFLILWGTSLVLQTIFSIFEDWKAGLVVVGDRMKRKIKFKKIIRGLFLIAGGNIILRLS